MQHHHIYLAAMIWFLVGNALHGLAQVNDLAQKNATSWKVVLKNRWVPLLVRAAFSLFIFLAFLEGQLSDVITAMHIPLPQWAQGLLGVNLNSGAIAAVCGYAFDSALGYVPFLQKIGLPPSIDQPTPTQPTPSAPGPTPESPAKGS